MKFYLLILIVFLAGCNSTPETDLSSKPGKFEKTNASQKVYYFQHKILPEWTYNTDGGFYSDLILGDLSKLKTAATDVISKDYANDIETIVLENGNSVLIKFPEPKAMANCYFVLIQKTDNGFSFYTYEKTMTFGENNPVIGVVGTWSPDGNHGNLGARTYIEADDFVADILGDNG